MGIYARGAYRCEIKIFNLPLNVAFLRYTFYAMNGRADLSNRMYSRNSKMRDARISPRAKKNTKAGASTVGKFRRCKKRRAPDMSEHARFVMGINELWPNVGNAGVLVGYELASQEMDMRRDWGNRNSASLLPASVIYGRRRKPSSPDLPRRPASFAIEINGFLIIKNFRLFRELLGLPFPPM